MTRQSLRLRLVLAQAATIALALLLAGLGLVLLFEWHLERRVQDELTTHLRQLAAGLVVTVDGALAVEGELADPRFERPLGGLYWQIQALPDGPMLRSRSLWDGVLPLPADALEPGVVHTHDLEGPDGVALLAQERLLLLPGPAGELPVRVAVAVERATLTAALAAYVPQLALALALLALALVAAGGAQAWFALRPLEQVRRAVEAVRRHRARKLEGRFPDEIGPLVDEVDALLLAQEQAIAAARARAGDLAHGLKTPLTVLETEARRLAASGDAETARTLGGIARDIRRHVDRELARTRLATAGGRVAPTPLRLAVDQVVRTLERTPAGDALAWTVAVDAGLRVAVDADDLLELLGNLLDNAAKWAEGAVEVAAAAAEGMVTLSIEDDGPGVPEADRARLGSRGVRLDEAVPGHGIGLAIARDIVQAYGGGIDFSAAASGGLAVTVRLPAGDQASIGHASMR